MTQKISNEKSIVQNAGDTDNFEYHNPAVNEFPIMAYYPTVRPGDDTDIPVTDCDLKVLRDCGFNIVYGNPRIWSFPMHTNVSGISFCLEMDGRNAPNIFYEDLKNYHVVQEIVESKVYPRNKNISMIDFNDEPTILR